MKKIKYLRMKTVMVIKVSLLQRHMRKQKNCIKKIIQIVPLLTEMKITDLVQDYSSR